MLHTLWYLAPFVRRRHTPPGYAFACLCAKLHRLKHRDLICPRCRFTVRIHGWSRRAIIHKLLA